jgi:predicted small lipoprotein YifL
LLLERAAGFERDDTSEVKLDKLEALLASASPAAGDVSLLAELLSLPACGRHPPLKLGPQRKKQRILAALLRLLASFARQQPVLMIFEDLHWIDPTSRELLDLIVEQVERLPMLLIATLRPEFQPPWTDQQQVTVMALTRLGRGEGMALVWQLVGKSLPNLRRQRHRIGGIAFKHLDRDRAAIGRAHQADDNLRPITTVVAAVAMLRQFAAASFEVSGGDVVGSSAPSFRWRRASWASRNGCSRPSQSRAA